MNHDRSYMDKLRNTVQYFRSVWFPTGGEDQPFWFRARQEKYRETIQNLCHECLSPILEFQSKSASDLLVDIQAADWSLEEQLILSVMFDQMPRNALAINYGPYAHAEPRRVDLAIDDSFSLQFAQSIRDIVDQQTIPDVRVVCFYSLVFRHSDRFDDARSVLETLSKKSEQGGLPLLAQKFWMETNKRQDALGT
jgi:uncharacterized protein (DUF924 family)